MLDRPKAFYYERIPGNAYLVGCLLVCLTLVEVAAFRERPSPPETR